MKRLFSQLFKHAIVLLLGLASVFCAHAMKMTKIRYSKKTLYVFSETLDTNKTLPVIFTEIDPKRLKGNYEQQELSKFNNWSDKSKKSFVDATMLDENKLDIESRITKHVADINLYRREINNINNVDINYELEKFIKASKAYFKNLLEGIKSKKINDDFSYNQSQYNYDFVKSLINGTWFWKYKKNFSNVEKYLEKHYYEIFNSVLVAKMVASEKNKNISIVVHCSDSLLNSISKHFKDLPSTHWWSGWFNRGSGSEEFSSSETECEYVSANSSVSRTGEYNYLDVEGTSHGEAEISLTLKYSQSDDESISHDKTELILGNSESDDVLLSSDSIKLALEGQKGISKDDSENVMEYDLKKELNNSSEEELDDKPYTQQDDSKEQTTTGLWKKLTSFFSSSFFKKYSKPLVGVGCLGCMAVLGAAYLYLKR